jgi:hypothetical protein
MLPKSDAVGYHTRFGIRDMQYPLRSTRYARLTFQGKTDIRTAIWWMCTAFLVLENRSFRQVDDTVAGSTRSLKVNA